MVKILKRPKNEEDVQIHPSQQEKFILEAHPPPSVQYTRVVQGTNRHLTMLWGLKGCLSKAVSVGFG
jgi:hypothetical protein